MNVLTITCDGRPVAMSCDDGLIAAVARALARDAVRRQDGTVEDALRTGLELERLGELTA